MQLLIEASVVLLAYIFGSIPFGLLIVKLTTGKDIRQVASGRTSFLAPRIGPSRPHLSEVHMLRRTPTLLPCVKSA